MSAASFLGIAGLIAFFGYDGFMFSVGWLVAYLTVLLVVAEPLRNAGKYTMADVLAYRLKARLTGEELPRIGLKGTARIYGEPVPLAYAVFRRPFAALRQWAGL